MQALQKKHLTVRIPWHDNKWNNTICSDPDANSSCMILKNIYLKKREDCVCCAKNAGQEIDKSSYPPCIGENAGFLSNDILHINKTHPYDFPHVLETNSDIPPHSVACIPYRWMLKKNAKEIAGLYHLEYEQQIEEEMLDRIRKIKSSPKMNTAWIQFYEHQERMLNTFFNSVNENESLVFFYAKKTPFSENNQKVIIGAGRVKAKGSIQQYNYSTPNTEEPPVRSYIWEQNITHSIDESCEDGFILPYHQLMTLAEDNTEIAQNFADYIAYVPNEALSEYSYGTELLSQDSAIASLISMENAIKNLRNVITDYNWEQIFSWIDAELNRLWQIRGAYPGIGSVLDAILDNSYGNLLAWYINEQAPDDPWSKFEELLAAPKNLPPYLRKSLGSTALRKWNKRTDKEKGYYKQLSRLELTNAQARLWVNDECIDEEVINDVMNNPFYFYECGFEEAPISLAVVDRAVFPAESLLQEHPFLDNWDWDMEYNDFRRVRAVIIHILQEAAPQGHTLLPSQVICERSEKINLKPTCKISKSLLELFDDEENDDLLSILDDKKFYQLEIYVETKRIITEAINHLCLLPDRVCNFEWRDMLDNEFGKINEGDDDEVLARKEKSVALQELYKKHFCILMGDAGTGKSTLLKMLCSLDEVRNEGLLLLAPTGKARVRMETATGMKGQAKTIAQFLKDWERYDGNYYVYPEAPRANMYKTVIIDECSMLTEEQLAATLDAIDGIDRLIMVGDTKQLPPIGAGKPFYDIVEQYQINDQNIFPHVKENFAELMIVRRQNPGLALRLANYFTDKNVEDQSLWNELKLGDHSITVLPWKNRKECEKQLVDAIVQHFKLGTADNCLGFDVEALGGTKGDTEKYDNYPIFFNYLFSYDDKTEKPAKIIEKWQILTPMRNDVDYFNQYIQKTFRKEAFQKLKDYEVIPPIGPQRIYYGDKVINIENSGRRKVYPQVDNSYIANGDIGLIVGRKTKKYTPYQLDVSFATLPDHKYAFEKKEFNGEEGQPPLELAYALTVHKAQGSEFGAVFLILPNNSYVVTRELIYTALTRYQNHIYLLCEGNVNELIKYNSETRSATKKRFSNLYELPSPYLLKLNKESALLDRRLLYLTERNELVKSKSEWIIADKLNHCNIDYTYEAPFHVNSLGYPIHPDFRVIDKKNNITWYWEHLGLMSKPKYRETWALKLKAYEEEGVVPLSQYVHGQSRGILLTTEEDGKRSDLSEQITETIKTIQRGDTHDN